MSTYATLWQSAALDSTFLHTCMYVCMLMNMCRGYRWIIPLGFQAAYRKSFDIIIMHLHFQKS